MTGRDSAIDVIRTLCIVSMTSAHLAARSLAWEVTHVLVWYDGAMGFVLLSGLVLGIVQHKTVQRSGLTAARTKALRRGGLVYVAHLGICALAFIVASVSESLDVRYAGVNDFSSWWEPIVAAMTLRINPKFASILSLYVILLALTPLASWALARGRGILLCAASVALFTVGSVWPAPFILPRVPGVPGHINWATWQLLFVAALIVGWNWSRIRGALTRPALWVTLLSVAALVGAAAQARTALAPSPGEGAIAVVDRLFDDGTIGIGTIVLAFVVVGGLYGALTPLADRLPRVAAEIGRIGRRSLDCYIILCILVITTPLFWIYDTTGRRAMLYAAATLALMYGWCVLRDRWTSRARAATAASEDEPGHEPVPLRT
ncbi:hypothetical protein JOD63_003145 [Microbacterium terrae]|uniref:OpgC protein n=1 Tax=Microbacterium terrae TaxID=69369 RepID=A0A0M2H2L2_9MICO|nr:OpgC domain-containing protein [Microbacterium terrae]KJL40498.1 OpgC protein [Microbacterium terrae]MBP1079177.1 hypothetical protein [Microbacterium terrae]GLJ98578.1 hypothetical protein GCM10017594_17750 [Microbacterium terrae]